MISTGKEGFTRKLKKTCGNVDEVKAYLLTRLFENNKRANNLYPNHDGCMNLSILWDQKDGSLLEGSEDGHIWEGNKYCGYADPAIARKKNKLILVKGSIYKWSTTSVYVVDD